MSGDPSRTVENTGKGRGKKKKCEKPGGELRKEGGWRGDFARKARLSIRRSELGGTSESENEGERENKGRKRETEGRELESEEKLKVDRGQHLEG